MYFYQSLSNHKNTKNHSRNLKYRCLSISSVVYVTKQNKQDLRRARPFKSNWTESLLLPFKTLKEVHRMNRAGCPGAALVGAVQMFNILCGGPSLPYFTPPVGLGVVKRFHKNANRPTTYCEPARCDVSPQLRRTCFLHRIKILFKKTM